MVSSEKLHSSVFFLRISVCLCGVHCHAASAPGEMPQSRAARQLWWRHDREEFHAPPSEDATAPSEPHRHAPSPQARRARIGTLLMFTVNGMTFASLIPCHPQIKADLGASRTTWGLAVELRPLGGLTLGLSAAHLIRRHGSRTIALWPQILSTTCLLLLARAPHIAWVFVAMGDDRHERLRRTHRHRHGQCQLHPGTSGWVRPHGGDVEQKVGFHDPPRAHRPAGRHRLAALGAGLPAGRGSADPDGHPGVPASHSGAPGPTHPQRR